MLVPLKGYGVNAVADLQVGEIAVVVAGELAMGGEISTYLNSWFTMTSPLLSWLA